jgi:hypothetical protein
MRIDATWEISTESRVPVSICVVAPSAATFVTWITIRVGASKEVLDPVPLVVHGARKWFLCYRAFPDLLRAIRALGPWHRAWLTSTEGSYRLTRGNVILGYFPYRSRQANL